MASGVGEVLGVATATTAGGSVGTTVSARTAEVAVGSFCVCPVQAMTSINTNATTMSDVLLNACS